MNEIESCWVTIVKPSRPLDLHDESKSEVTYFFDRHTTMVIRVARESGIEYSSRLNTVVVISSFEAWQGLMTRQHQPHVEYGVREGVPFAVINIAETKDVHDSLLIFFARPRWGSRLSNDSSLGVNLSLDVREYLQVYNTGKLDTLLVDYLTCSLQPQYVVRTQLGDQMLAKLWS